MSHAVLRTARGEYLISGSSLSTLPQLLLNPLELSTQTAANPHHSTMSLSTRDFAGVAESKQLRSRTPTPSVLESSGASYKALRDASKAPRRHRRISTRTFTSRILERPKLFAGIVLLLLSAWAIIYLLRDLLMMARFKLRDRAYEEGWVNGCGLRKRPLLFVRGEGEVAVVWETNCEQEFELAWGVEEVVSRRWGRTRKTVERWETLPATRTQLPDETNTHFVYTAILSSLAGNATYAYTIALRESPSSHLASHFFPFHGPTTSPTTIHLAALSDNQFNLRTFHRILHTLHTFSHTLPSSPLPSLLLHLGDNVQTPHSLPQWQTDFWDPLTSFLPTPFGQSTPILLARGNHDWDSSGSNTYVGGSPARREWLASRGRVPTARHRGTYMSYSPHARCRILVLDSNLGTEEQVEQEEWLEWELGRREWREASLRIALVHVPPFVEYWDKEAWTTGGEREWCVSSFLASRTNPSRRSSYVRHRLTPLLTTHHVTLLLSGHSHTYSRGFLPLSLTPSYTTSLTPFALAASHERGWEKTPQGESEVGTVYTVIGGAGGTLDEDRVGEWGFWEGGERRFHFVWMTLRFGVAEGEEREKGERVYRVERRGKCEEEVRDVLEWKAVGLDGKVFDRFRIEAEGCG